MNDITNACLSGEDVSISNPRGKFIEFTPFITSSEDVQFKRPRRLTEFRSSEFEVENLTTKMKYEALRRMTSRILLLIDKEVENELISIKQELTEKHRKKHSVDELFAKMQAMQDSLEAS